MSPAPAAHGRIITLYSFKGGVGRTMAGANIAFTAAMSGLRVLVMDWDLEAPGMAYYFRGLSGPEQSRAIKTAPGVLDLVWEWRRQVSDAAGDDDVEALLAPYATGAPFEACTRCVLDENRLPAGARLDILGAGSREIDEAHSYADALARFSWPEFMDVAFGGLFIDRLRTWAKSRYDLVVVDSRTGYADVASVCTVQLPDVVALTFIYNRQNMEGIAHVADAIAAERGSDVRLRAVPMRLSREGTLDEAEARGRAVRHLTRNGAFTEEAAKTDLDRLPVRTAQGLPFYETLAALMPASSSAELLALDYRRLAEALCEQPLPFPEVDEAWRESVARRLEPKTASAEYVNDLRQADPVRAAEELDRLLDGALESELHNDRLERDYIEALITTGIELSDYLFEEVAGDEVEAIAEKAVALARSEYEMEPMEWASVYVAAMVAFDDQFGAPQDPAERSATLTNYDRILANGAWSAEVLFERAAIRRELVSIMEKDEPEEGLRQLDEAGALLGGVRGTEHRGALSIERGQLLFQRARLLRVLSRPEDAEAAARSALEAVEAVPPEERARVGRLAADVHLFLARVLSDPEKAADHVLRAADQPMILTPVLSDIGQATTILLRAGQRAPRAINFIRRLTPPTSARNAHAPAFYFSRSPAAASALIKAAIRLMDALVSTDSAEASEAREALIRTVATCLDILRRRPVFSGPTYRRRDLFKLVAETSGLIQFASEMSPPPGGLRELMRAAANIELITGDPGEAAGDPAPDDAP